LTDNLSSASVTGRNTILHLLFPCIIFTLFYWNAALSKPFHVDELFSWVYAERCSIQEILTLKDSGIGHPPFYHLIQKTIQIIFTEYHPYHIRIANYFIGLGFLIILIRFLQKYRSVPIFYCGLASSACILNIFVFSRMWGLVCLFSILFISIGESYLEKNSNKLPLFLIIGILGITADYNFILLIPYMATVYLAKKRISISKNQLAGLVIIFMIAMFAISAIKYNLNYAVYYSISSIPRMAFQTGNMIFKFLYVEPFLIAILCVCLIYLFNWIRDRNDKERCSGQLTIAVLLTTILIIVHILIRYNDVEVRYLSLIIIGSCVFLAYRIFMMDSEGDTLENENRRFAISIIFGILLLLSINPVMWTDVREGRFVAILLPLIIVIIYRSHRIYIINILSVIFLLSGILYSHSYAVGTFQPAPGNMGKNNFIYQNIITYSDQYLRYDKQKGREGYLIEMAPFDYSCRVCRLGKSNIEYENYQSVIIVGLDNFIAEGTLKRDFMLKDKKNIEMAEIDRIQNQYFTPILYQKMAIYEYSRKNDN